MADRQYVRTWPDGRMFGCGRFYPGVVARADVRDDRIRRFIVYHFRYDAERHERRHVVVDAFDNQRDFTACFKQAQAGIERRRDRGEDVDPDEHISGRAREPGDDRRAANGHLVTRSMRHGLDAGKWVEDLEMPSNMSLMGSDDAAGSRLGWVGRLRRLVPQRPRGTDRR